jgi:hypothetical protein
LEIIVRPVRKSPISLRRFPNFREQMNQPNR